MNTPANPGDLSLPTDDLPGRFGAILYALVVAITTLFVPRPARLAALHPVCTYILRTRARLARLIHRLLAGHTPRPRKPGTPNPAPKPNPRAPRLRLSQARGWLLRDSDHWVRGHRGHFELALAQPQAAALIAASPQAQRLLRPLLRMLAIDAACVPPNPPTPTLRKPRQPRAAKPRQPGYAERRAALWYPNIEGKPMNLLPPRRARHH